MRGFPAGRRAAALLFAVVAWLAAVPAAAAAPMDKSDLVDAETGEVVVGGFSLLEREDHGIATTIRTRDTAGHAYTLWYVIFNAPQHCSGGVCDENDIFDFHPENSFFPFNEPQIRATRVSLLWGKAGAVANAAGRVKLDGGIAVNEVPDGDAQVVIGRADDGALVPLGVTAGLENPHGAHITVILQGHGAAHDDPDQLHAQLSSFQGACNPDCSEPQHAVHLP